MNLQLVEKLVQLSVFISMRRIHLSDVIILIEQSSIQTTDYDTKAVCESLIRSDSNDIIRNELQICHLILYSINASIECEEFSLMLIFVNDRRQNVLIFDSNIVENVEYEFRLIHDHLLIITTRTVD